MPAFFLFTSLPSEIRLTIWEATVVPREVRIVRHFPPLGRRVDEWWTSTTPIPPALHACRESRKHLSQIYIQTFERNGQYVWANASKDWLCVDWHILHRFLDSPYAPPFFPLRKLVVEVSNIVMFNGPGLYRLEELQETLRDLTFVHLDRPDLIPWRRDYTPPPVEWQESYLHMLKSWYWTCKPVPWYTRCRNPDKADLDLTTENYVKWERDRRLRTNTLSGIELLESSRDEIANNARIYWTWIHDGCDCVEEGRIYEPAQKQIDALREQDGREDTVGVGANIND